MSIFAVSAHIRITTIAIYLAFCLTLEEDEGEEWCREPTYGAIYLLYRLDLFTPTNKH